jgi:arylsulfatase A-like enzyme
MKFCVVGLFVALAAIAEPLNIVLFLSDDLGRLDTSIHGSVDARTPTMDMLAAKGMTFDNAYVASPACCPNRFSLLTGLMPARHGAHPNHSKVKEGTAFLPPVLKQMGYHIASFGKVAHGRRDYAGADANSPAPEGMSQNIVRYFAEQKVDRPVCLMVGDRRPHVPWIKEATYEPDKLTLPPFFVDTKETREHWARYLTDITNMDAEMGRVYEFAQKQFGDNFIFLFSSDHGGQWPFGKWNLYDYGARVPLVVVWPGKVKPGTRSDAMVSWVDILPTLIDAAEGDVPEGIDGRSFVPVLTGDAAQHRDKIFTTHTGDGGMNIFPIRSVRVGKYKYIHNLRPGAYHTNHSDRLRKDGAGAYWHSWDTAAKTDPRAKEILKQYYTRAEFELFDLEKDPLERNNLAKNPEYAAKLQSLRAELAAWTAAQGDDLRPHREPYSTDKPIPVVKSPVRKRKKPKK